MAEERPRPKPSMRNSMTNWRKSGLPFLSKLGVAMRNNWTKLRTRQNCCGNYDQPGR